MVYVLKSQLFSPYTLSVRMYTQAPTSLSLSPSYQERLDRVSAVVWGSHRLKPGKAHANRRQQGAIFFSAFFSSKGFAAASNNWEEGTTVTDAFRPFYTHMTIGLAGGIAGLVCLRLSRGVTKKKALTSYRRLRTLPNSESNLITAHLSCDITRWLLDYVAPAWS